MHRSDGSHAGTLHVQVEHDVHFLLHVRARGATLAQHRRLAYGRAVLTRPAQQATPCLAERRVHTIKGAATPPHEQQWQLRTVWHGIMLDALA